MRCKTCGESSWPNKWVCPICLKEWTSMRSIAFKFLQDKYGKLCPDNLSIIQKEIKKLERIWRKDPDEFNRLVNII